jgi:hypothetical protein
MRRGTGITALCLLAALLAWLWLRAGETAQDSAPAAEAPAPAQRDISDPAARTSARPRASDAPPDLAETTRTAEHAGAGQRILVRVVGPGGAPLARAGLEVHASADHGAVRHGLDSATTDESGTADLTPALRGNALPDDGALLVHVTGEGLFRQGQVPSFPDRRIPASELSRLRAAAAPGDLVLDVPARTHVEIELRVRERATSRPVGGLVVAADPPEAFGAATYTTDAQGIAAVRLISLRQHGAPEEPALVAGPPYVGRWAYSGLVMSEPFDEDAGVTDENGRFVASMRVTPARVVRCVLVGPDGAAIAGAVSSPRHHDPALPVRTDAEGRFETTVPSDDERVAVAFPGWVVASVPLPPEGEDARLVAWRERHVQMVVAGGPDVLRSLSARLVAVPLRGVAEWERSHSVKTVGGTAGVERTLTADAPARDLDVVVTSGDRRWRAEGRVPADQDTVHVTLQPVGEHVVTLEVRDGRGVPIRGLRVSLGTAEFAVLATTDMAGTVRLAVPAGRHADVRVEVAGHVPVPSEVDLDPALAGPVRITAQPEVEVLVAPAAKEPTWPTNQLTQVLQDGTRLLAESGGFSWSGDGRESLSFRLSASAPSTLQATIAGRSFTWTYDPSKPQVYEAKLD